MRARHFSWKARSPTASTSSTSRMSASRCVATANPRRMAIPVENVFTAESMKPSSSAKATMRS
jgi:hypothetical protein